MVGDGGSKVLVRKRKDDPNIFILARICPELREITLTVSQSK